LVLAEEIRRRIHAGSRGAYGSPRVTAELRENGRQVNHKQVARVMRTHAIAGIRLRRRVRTTIAEPAAQQIPDLFRGTSPPPNRAASTWATSRTAPGRRPVPQSGDRPGLLQPQGRRLVHRRPHAHHAGRRRPAYGRRHPRQPAGGGVPHRPPIESKQYASRAFADLFSELGVAQSM